MKRTRQSLERAFHDTRADLKYSLRLFARQPGVLFLAALRGETFTRDEVGARAPVAVVSQSLARAYWHGQSPVGQMLPEVIKIPEIPSCRDRWSSAWSAMRFRRDFTNEARSLFTNRWTLQPNSLRS